MVEFSSAHRNLSLFVVSKLLLLENKSRKPLSTTVKLAHQVKLNSLQTMNVKTTLLMLSSALLLNPQLKSALKNTLPSVLGSTMMLSVFYTPVLLKAPTDVMHVLFNKFSSLLKVVVPRVFEKNYNRFTDKQLNLYSIGIYLHVCSFFYWETTHHFLNSRFSDFMHIIYIFQNDDLLLLFPQSYSKRKE